MQLNFPMALKAAEGLLDRLEIANTDNSAELQSEIDEFMKSEEACRGFFVVLLTNDRAIADNPPSILIESMKQAGQIPASVLTRNLVMSAATKVVHLRNLDHDSAAGSEQVTLRTQELFRKLRAEQFSKLLLSMRSTLAGESEEFAAFLARTNYDEEQKCAAIKAIDALLSN